MRSFLSVLLALFLAQSSWAGVASTTTPPTTGGGDTFTGGTITTPILAPAADNCASVPYSFTGDTNTGLCSSAADTVVLRAGGVSQFTQTTTGITSTVPLLLPSGSASAPSLSYSASTGLGTYRIDSNTLCLTAWGSGCNLEWDGNAGLQIGYGQPLGFSSSATTGAADVFLRRDAANTMAQRNGTAAQAFNIYNTYTDASNYERLNIGTNSITAFIYASAAGTGTQRPLDFGANGSVQWRITTSGHYIALTDNAFDIGASGATRPRSGYFGTSVVTPKAYVTTSESPASGAACTAGQFTWDASYIYVCTASGAWKRAALTGGY